MSPDPKPATPADAPDPSRPSPVSPPTTPGYPDDARARPEPARNNAAPADSDAIVGKVLPPNSPVDAPRLPPKPTAETPNEAGSDSQPAADAQPDSNWADNTQPRPYAKKARSSLV